MNRVTAILQARVSSTRLPGKVLRPLLGEPMLARQIERVQRCQQIDQLVVATSEDSSDDPLAAWCAEHGIACFRGSLPDVLARFYHAAQAYPAEHIVRLTGDCPLADPGIIDAVIVAHLRGGYGYTSNVDPPTFPDGLDVEVMQARWLTQAFQQAQLPSQREHVTPWVRQHVPADQQHCLRHDEDLSALRWTVDEPEDFVLIEKVYQALYANNPAFDWQDVNALLVQHPEWQHLNDGFLRNAGCQPLATD